MTDLAFVAVGMVAATQQGPTDLTTVATPDILRREEALIASIVGYSQVRRSPIAQQPVRHLARESFEAAPPNFSDTPSQLQPSSRGYRIITKESTRPNSNRFSPSVAALPTSTAEAALVQRLATAHQPSRVASVQSASIRPTSIRPASSQLMSPRSAIPLTVQPNQPRPEFSSQPPAVAMPPAQPQQAAVHPEDWAYRSAEYLVNRYGCGSPQSQQVLAARQPLSRAAFARNIDACLNEVIRLAFAGASPTHAAKDDLAVVQALQRQFYGELVAARSVAPESENALHPPGFYGRVVRHSARPTTRARALPRYSEVPFSYREPIQATLRL